MTKGKQLQGRRELWLAYPTIMVQSLINMLHTMKMKHESRLPPVAQVVWGKRDQNCSWQLNSYLNRLMWRSCSVCSPQIQWLVVSAGHIYDLSVLFMRIQNLVAPFEILSQILHGWKEEDPTKCVIFGRIYDDFPLICIEIKSLFLWPCGRDIRLEPIGA